MYQIVPEITIGPIIGKVTATSARILAEFNCQGGVSCFLVNEAGQSIRLDAMVPANRPVVFKFDVLTKGTLYKVTFANFKHIESQFRTLDDSNDLRVATVSCNEYSFAIKKNDKNDLFLDLYKKAANREIDYIFHIGDQVYMDMSEQGDKNTPYFQSIKILNETPKDQWNFKRDLILELLRNQYRKTWGIPSIRAALANCPNLTILDDHEARDDFGWRKEDWDSNTQKPDYFYLQLARIVYYEYQRQLRVDVDFNNLGLIQEEYWAEILNHTGVVCVEYRACRTWHRGTSQMGDSEIGGRQWQFLNGCFGKGGFFQNCKNVLFLSPLVVVLFGPKQTRLATKFSDDA
jgi:hypothetical protein